MVHLPWFCLGTPYIYSQLYIIIFTIKFVPYFKTKVSNEPLLYTYFSDIIIISFTLNVAKVVYDIAGCLQVLTLV